MAQVYKWVESGPGRGMETDLAVGLTRDGRSGLKREVKAAEGRAKAALNAYSEDRTGSSYISVEKTAGGSPNDRGGSHWGYVVWLNDDRGQQAANIIEFGRKGNKPESKNNSPSRAVAPLQRAFGVHWGGNF